MEVVYDLGVLKNFETKKIMQKESIEFVKNFNYIKSFCIVDFLYQSILIFPYIYIYIYIYIYCLQEKPTQFGLSVWKSSTQFGLRVWKHFGLEVSKYFLVLQIMQRQLVKLINIFEFYQVLIHNFLS